ncbi:MAG: hypothetical protein NTZ78_05680 [Candidatus Aureabacteria bacterium]|nr:hypothetical protein [Candidatus Auribacterota bacterium]
MKKVARLFPLLMVSLTTVALAAESLFPPPELTGTWEGTSQLTRELWIQPDQKNSVENWLTVSLTVLPNGAVEGKAGGASLANCVVKRNRGWLARKFNIRTDYIIAGYLNGKIAPKDTAGLKQITIPFNIIDGRIQGSIFTLKKWRYPNPVFPRLHIVRKQKP